MLKCNRVREFYGIEHSDIFSERLHNIKVNAQNFISWGFTYYSL